MLTRVPTNSSQVLSMHRLARFSTRVPNGVKTAFLSLPGICTGDIWHTAAAHLLWTLEPRDPKVQFVTLLTVPEDASQSILEPGVGRVPAMYEYLTNLGLPCVVAKLPAAGPVDEEDCEQAAAMIGADQLDQLLTNQVNQRFPCFHTLWQSLSPVQLVSSTTKGVVGGSRNHLLPPVHHYAATTVLASYFREDMPLHVRKARGDLLRNGLPGNLSRDDPIFLEVMQKVQQLRSLICRARSSAGSSLEQARVVLFIYRLVGRSQRNMNPHQDASRDIFDQVRQAALRRGLVTIRVPHGVPAGEIQDDDLDLFDVRGGPDGVIKDKRFVACFWAQVCDMPEVFGAVGSRTGSLDIAAFVGLNCLEWDEPLLLEIEGKEYGAAWDSLRLSRQHLEKQVPQHLRLLTQSHLMSITVLAQASFDSLAGRYTRIDEENLDSWLAGGSNLMPHIPSDEKTVKILVYPFGRQCANHQ